VCILARIPSGHSGETTARPLVLEMRVVNALRRRRGVRRVFVGRCGSCGCGEQRAINFSPEFLLAKLVIKFGFLVVLCGIIRNAFAARGVGDWRRRLQR